MKASFLVLNVLSIATVLVYVSGCAGPAAPTRPGVPANAMEVASGGKVVAFTAAHDGKAYLNDDTMHYVVYSTELKRDQVMRFDPASDTVRIDGNTAPEGIPDPMHDHSIYFVRSEKPDHADAAMNNTNSSSNSNSTANPTNQAVPTVRVPIGVQVEVQPQPSQQPQQPAAK